MRKIFQYSKRVAVNVCILRSGRSRCMGIFFLRNATQAHHLRAQLQYSSIERKIYLFFGLSFSIFAFNDTDGILVRHSDACVQCVCVGLEETPRKCAYARDFCFVCQQRDIKLPIPGVCLSNLSSIVVCITKQS